MPRLSQLIVYVWEEGRSSLGRGLAAPLQEPLIQTTASGLLRCRRLQVELLDSFGQNTEKLGVHSSPGVDGL